LADQIRAPYGTARPGKFRARPRAEIELTTATVTEFAEYAAWVETSSSLNTADARSVTVEFAGESGRGRDPGSDRELNRHFGRTRHFADSAKKKAVRTFEILPP